jgi:hypothetical protein
MMHTLHAFSCMARHTKGCSLALFFVSEVFFPMCNTGDAMDSGGNVRVSFCPVDLLRVLSSK